VWDLLIPLQKAVQLFFADVHRVRTYDTHLVDILLVPVGVVKRRIERSVEQRKVLLRNVRAREVRIVSSIKVTFLPTT